MLPSVFCSHMPQAHGTGMLRYFSSLRLKTLGAEFREQEELPGLGGQTPE